MRGKTFVLICALALAKVEGVRLNRHGCPIDLTIDSGLYPNCNRNIKNYNAADNADPKQAPTICAAPDSDSILVAHEHCNQFYQCWDGKPIAMSCYGELQYNPALEICDWPATVECGTRIIPECNEGDDQNNDEEESPTTCTAENSRDILLAHKDCNKFYRCVAGNLVTYTCPGNLLYNTIAGYCDCACNVTCGDRVIPEQNDSSSNGAGNCDPNEAGNICAKDDSDGVLVAHEKCNKFYKCVNGVPVTQNCPAGLLFNPAKDVCDWPENVSCGERIISENGSEEVNNGSDGNSDSDNGESGNADSGNGSNGAGNCDPSEAGNICAKDGSDGALVAHEKCNKFYKCVNSVPVTQNCPTGLLFNPAKDVCDWPDNVNCGDRIIQENESEENSIENGDNSGNGDSGNGGSGTCNCNPGEAASICSGPDSEGVLVAHENCNQFYVCVGGKNVVMSCPSGLLYNPYTEVCDWPGNVNCGDRVIPENGGSDNGDSGNGGNGGSGNGDSGNSESGNGDSDNGSNGAGNCDPSEAGNICAKDGSDGVLVAHEKCNKFYKCSNGVPVTQNCPAGLLFNPAKDVCDWPDNVNCGDRIIQENESEENSIENGDNSGNGDSGNGGSGNGDSGNGGNGTCNCNPGEAASICSGPDSEGVLVAHENCNQFYVCVGGKNVVRSCPSGLLYNPYTEVCDWPGNVNCGDRVIPENGGSDNGDSGNGGNGGSGNGDSGNSESGNGDSGNGSNGAGNCDPSEAGNICATDGSDGVLVAHEKCNKFYKCVNGVPVTQNCPAGLLFNPAKDVCDWPDNVNCGDRIIQENESEENSIENGDNSGNGDSGNGGSGNGDSGNGGNGTCNCNPGEAASICSGPDSEGVLVAHENCNQFYVCVGGKNVVMSCPSGLLYNPYTEVCDWPGNVNCGDRVIPENGGSGNGDSGNGDSGNGGNGGSGDGDSGNSESGNGDSGNGSNGAGNCDPSEAGNICAKDGSDGTLVAHENCNKFYKCVNGVPVTQNCPAGLLFNPAKDVCDWPDNVNCGDRIIQENESEENSIENGDNSGNGDSGNGGSGNGDSGNGGNGTCNCNPGEAASICSGPDSEGVLVAHENCNQFYVCVGGKNVVMSCPSGLLYNPYTEVCDWPGNVNCGDRVIPENGGSDNGDSGNGGNGGSGNGDSGNSESGNGDSGNGSNGAGNCDPSEAGNICAKDGSDGVLVAHEKCNKFYKCSNGVPVTQNCPAGLLFNPAKDVCDWPDNVNCGDRIIQENESEENSIENGDNSGNGDSGNGGSGIGDSGNGGSGNGDSGNGGSGTCNCNPGEAASICSVPDSEGVLVAHENCNQFYVCVGGKNVAMSCPSGLLYNPYTEVCDWPGNVNCGDRVIPENGGSGNGDSGNGDSGNGGNGGSGDGDSGNSESGNGDSGNGSNGAGNCDPSEAGNICAKDGSDGTLVAHEKCNKFYKCVNGVPVTQNCPAGLLFNPAKDVCDWPDNVNCGDRIIQENESEENSIENGDNSGNGDSGNGDSGNGGSGTCNCNPGEAASICSGPDSEGMLVAHENCNQFYVCVGGKNVVMSCPSGLLYNPYTEVCDWPGNVNCGDRVIPENGGSDNGDSGNGGNGGSGNGDSGNGDSGNGSNGAGNCDPSEAGNICAKDGSDGVLVAHEKCNKFYKCSNGVPETQNCPAGLLFNPAKDVCDWPDNVNCGDRIIQENGSEENSIENGDNSGNGDSGNGGSGIGDSGNGDSGNGGSGTCNCNPGEAASICSVPDSEGVLVAHENCNQFYVCVGGKNVAMSCPSGLLYNPYTEVCDWPGNVNCGDRVIPENSGSGNGDSGNGDSGNGGNGGSGDGDSGNSESGNGDSGNGSNGAGNCDPSEAGNICAKDGSDGVLVAHEKCNKFYKCSNGVPEIQNCPAGLLFNPAKDVCDWPDNVNCGDRIIQENGSEENSIDNGDNSGNGDSGNGGSGNGDSGNGGSGTCNCNPAEAASICSGPDSEGVLVAHGNCNQFYVCVGGRNVVMSCPSGLLYNPYTEVCDWPGNVNCGDRVIPENGGSDNGDSGNGGNGGSNNGDSGNVESGNGDSGNGSNGAGNCDPSEAGNICAKDGSDGVLVAHEKCNKFYKCSNGVPETQNCPAGLLFNPAKDVCDWPDNVNCGDRIIQENGSEENSIENGDNSGNGDSGNGGSGIGDSGNGGSGNGDSGNGESSTCNCNPSEAAAICSGSGSEGTLVAHENCHQFYICLGGTNVTLDCPTGLLYSPNKLVCDWPESVNCGDRLVPGSASEVEEEKDEISSYDYAVAMCSLANSAGMTYPHDDCNRYYLCANFQPILYRCGSGLLYDLNRKRCFWQENVNCGDRTRSMATSFNKHLEGRQSLRNL